MSFFPQQKAELTLPNPMGNGSWVIGRQLPSSPCSPLLPAVVTLESPRGFLAEQKWLSMQNKRLDTKGDLGQGGLECKHGVREGISAGLRSAVL